jgi:hypothetical protein
MRNRAVSPYHATLRLRSVSDTAPRQAGETSETAPKQSGIGWAGSWRADLRRHVIALLEERRHDDLLGLLCSAREQHPDDLEIERSIRVLERHLTGDDAA